MSGPTPFTLFRWPIQSAPEAFVVPGIMNETVPPAPATGSAAFDPDGWTYRYGNPGDFVWRYWIHALENMMIATDVRARNAL